MFKKIQRLDDKVVENIIRYRSPLKNKIMIIASTAGNMGAIWFAFCIPFLIYAPWRLIGVNIIAGMAVTQLMCEIIIKRIVRRERPVWHLSDDEQLIRRPKYYSFPSGHTTAAFAVAAVVFWRCNIQVIIMVWICSVTIAFSRVYLRVHYLSDVVAGAIMGFGFGSITVWLCVYLESIY